MSESMLHWSVPSGRGEYVQFVEDVMRMATIQFVLQILMALQGIATFSLDFIVYLLQVMVGVAVYWLVVRRVVRVGPDREKFRGRM